MKTNFKTRKGNNVQKAVLRSAAVVVSFILISFTVSGQDFWKKLLFNSGFNKIALATVEPVGKTSDPKPVTKIFNFDLLETAVEPTLEVEDWMLDDNYFGVPELRATKANEAALKVEYWMLDDNNFSVTEIDESPLQLEAWMTSDAEWEI